jgi:hypothetical protein
MAPEIYCKPLSNFTANNGKPNGLVRYARNNSISPFCQEYVTRTVMPSRVSSILANPKIREEHEINPMQSKVNRSSTRRNGVNKILRISFIWMPPSL